MKCSGYDARVFSVIDLILELYAARDRIEDHILEDRAEHLRRAVDVRLALRREIDHLGVAAALEVEDAFGRPPVLVVADEARARGSADSVVLPVPDRPKNSAVSPALPTFAEQCIESTPCFGR